MRPGCEWSTRGLVCGGNRNTHSHTPIPSLPQALLCLASFHQLYPHPCSGNTVSHALGHREAPKSHCFRGETEAPGGEAGGPGSRAPHQLQGLHPPPGARRPCMTWEDRKCLPAPFGWW